MTTLHASALSAPPPPAFPALTQPLAPDDLASALRALSGSYYANHPFHSLMHEGRLTRAAAAGLGRQSTRLSTRDPAKGRGDHLQLP